MTLEHFLWTFIISAAPVVELRGSLPLALIEYDISWYYALPVCIVGNLLPVPFLLLFLDPVSRWISKVQIFKRLLDWIFKRTRRKDKLVKKYQRIGLILVVAIPLPGTGAWTGSILAFLLGLEFRSSFISIAIGVLLAGIAVTIMSLLGWVGAIIAGIGLITVAALGILRS